jgi:hypothetical protein
MEDNNTSTTLKTKRLFLRDKIAKHKKSCLSAIALIIVVIFLIVICAHNCPPDHFMAKYKPAWSSPDYKLLGKNHTSKARRSDSKEDNWNKKDFLKSVEHFNKIASISQ